MSGVCSYEYVPEPPGEHRYGMFLRIDAYPSIFGTLSGGGSVGWPRINL